MRLHPSHFRTRLTLSYVSMLAGLLVTCMGASTCALLFWQPPKPLDHFAVQEIETVEGLFFLCRDGQLHLCRGLPNHPENKELIDRYLEVRSLDGAVLLRNEKLGSRSLGDALREKGWGDTGTIRASLRWNPRAFG